MALVRGWREGGGGADLEVSHVGLFIESSRGESESVNNVVNLRLSLLEFLRGFLSGPAAHAVDQQRDEEQRGERGKVTRWLQC